MLWSVIIQLRAYTALPAFTPLTPLLADSSGPHQLSTPKPHSLSHVRRADEKALSWEQKGEQPPRDPATNRTFYARQNPLFHMSNFSRDFTRGRQLYSKTCTKESEKNFYLKWEFKSFLTISDTILYPWPLHFFVQTWFFSDFIDCHMKHNSIHNVPPFVISSHYTGTNSHKPKWSHFYNDVRQL